MSEKTRETRDDGQEDILEQVITQGLHEIKAPAQTEAAEARTGETPSASQREDASPAARKNRRSAVYLYLLILFGAAFMMLLLAYFVQQRNSETTISDLRNTMNLSREELMDEIRDLEKKNSALEAALRSSEAGIAQRDQEIGDLRDQADSYDRYVAWIYDEKLLSDTLSWLERFCAEKDWLMAAVIVQECDPYLNEHNRDYSPITYWNASDPTPGLDLDPVQAQRYLELREQVFDNAGFMKMESWTTGPEDQAYTERPYIEPSAGRYDGDTVSIAQSLWAVLGGRSQYSYSGAASRIAEICNDDEALGRLNSRAFQPSTVRLFDEIVDLFIDSGALVREEGGALTPTVAVLPANITPFGSGLPMNNVIRGYEG